MVHDSHAQDIVIGLGNPSAEYESTYHNVGLLALEAVVKKIAAESGAEVRFKKYGDLFEYAKTERMVIVKPLVFMNGSGRAVAEALRVFQSVPQRLIVLHDESDLPVGEFQVSVGRGAAGHHGIESIVDSLHANDFTRIRIGIREPNEERRKKASEFVLQPIRAAHKKILETVFENVAEKLLG